MGLSKIGIRRGSVWAFFCTLMFIIGSTAPVMADNGHGPAPEPPKVDLGESGIFRPLDLQSFDTPTSEWIYHKTSDSVHPDGNEQQMVWLMNRARANPVQEGVWLATTDDSGVASSRSYWQVDTDLLQNEFTGYDAKPPAAFDARLYNAARAHSEDLILRDAQDHNGQFDRIDAAGFNYSQARGNVFSYTEYALYGHAGFNIDWGSDGGDGSGMQDGRGHRMAIMSVDGDYTNVGLSMVPVSDSGKTVGPYVTTGNYCRAGSGVSNHYNRFLVGTVWQDLNANEQYDPGEGMSGITVLPNRGTYYAVTADAGGYAIPILSQGSYDVTFSGVGIDGDTSRHVEIADQSVLLDLQYTPGAAELEAVTGAASDITATAANLNGTLHVGQEPVDYYFQYGSTTAYGATTPADTASSDSTVTAVVTGLTPGTTYHYRLVAAGRSEISYGIDHSFQTSTSDASQDAEAASSGGGGGGGCFIMSVGQ